MKTALLFVSLLSLTAFGCATVPESEEMGGTASEIQGGDTTTKTVKATTEARFDLLPGVWKVTGVSNQDDLRFGLVEFGGDHALNHRLFLVARGADKNGVGGVFELHQDAKEVTFLALTGKNTIEIAGLYDMLNAANGAITRLAFGATINLTTTTKGVTGASITRDGKTDKLAMAKDADQQLFGALSSVLQETTAGGTVVRIFEDGTDNYPAPNGDHLLLNVSANAKTKTYDLGLDVKSLIQMTVQSDTSALLEGYEDYTDWTGVQKNRPYTYRIDFAIGADGSPAPIVQLTRLQ